MNDKRQITAEPFQKERGRLKKKKRNLKNYEKKNKITVKTRI